MNKVSYASLIENRRITLKDIPLEKLNKELFFKYVEANLDSQDFFEGIPEPLITPAVVNFYLNAHLHDIRFYFSCIPKKYLTQEVCNKFLTITKELSQIPEEYLTEEMLHRYISLRRDITAIPKGYLTKEMCDNYISHGGDISNVPGEYLTEKLINDYISLGGDISNIPSEHLTEELCWNYLRYPHNIHHLIKKIPAELITPEMYEAYLLDDSIKPKKYRYKIDKSYSSESEMIQKAYIKYFVFGGDIAEVPEKYITPDLCEKYYEIYILRGGNIKKVPGEYLTEKLINDYISQGGNITAVPKEYLTQEMCDNYISQGGDIDKVPEEYAVSSLDKKYDSTTVTLSQDSNPLFDFSSLFYKEPDKKENLKEEKQETYDQETYNSYIARGGDIDKVPEEYITLDLCVTYVHTRRDINKVPAKFITLDFWKCYLNKYGNLYDIPSTFFTNEILDQISNDYSDYFNLFSNAVKSKVIDYELRKIERDGGTKQYLYDKYEGSFPIVEKVLEEIELHDPERYQRLLNRFEHNSNNWLQDKFQKIIELSNIITSLGAIDVKKGLNAEQKIRFTYLVTKENLLCEFSDIYNLVKKEKYGKESLIVSRFFKNYLGYRYRNMKEDGRIELYIDEKYLATHGGDWLKEYNIEKDFFAQDGKPIIHKYYDSDGNIVEIDTETAKQIIDILRENDISTKNCIVKEAFRRYARNELDVFIQNIESEDYLSNTSRKGK